jgi:hypothetical protein
MGLRTIRVGLKKLAARLGKGFPVRRSRNVTFAPETKLLPLIANVCDLFEPVTGLGLTLSIMGVTAPAGVWK